jgi:hypothetical protein
LGTPEKCCITLFDRPQHVFTLKTRIPCVFKWIKDGIKKHMDLCLFPIELPKNGVELVFTQRCGLKHQQSTILWRFEHPKPEFHHQMGLDLSVKSWTSA